MVTKKVQVFHIQQALHNLNDSLSVYAEGEMKDLDSGSDTTSWSIGSKFTF